MAKIIGGITTSHIPAVGNAISEGLTQDPPPSARRCYKIGQALKTAIESYPEA